MASDYCFDVWPLVPSVNPNDFQSSLAIKLLSMRHCKYSFAWSRHKELSSRFRRKQLIYWIIWRLHTFSWSNGKLPLSGGVGMNRFWPNVAEDITFLPIKKQSLSKLILWLAFRPRDIFLVKLVIEHIFTFSMHEMRNRVVLFQYATLPLILSLWQLFTANGELIVFHTVKHRWRSWERILAIFLNSRRLVSTRSAVPTELGKSVEKGLLQNIIHRTVIELIRFRSIEKS